MLGTAVGRRGDRADRVLAASIGRPPDGRAGTAQVLGHADRAHARTAAAVRDAEGLVQVEVTDVGADVAGRHRPTCAFMFAPSM